MRRHERAGAAVRRLAAMLIAAVVVLVASFLLVHLIPGDPATQIAGYYATPEVRAEINRQLGLNRPLLHQFVDYVNDVVHLRFGTSFTQHQPVTTLIGSRLAKTLELAFASFALTMLIGVPVGLVVGALTREGRRRHLDHAFTATTSLVHSIPDYLIATFLVFAFAVTWSLFPVAGADGPLSLVLPAVAVAAVPATVIARLTRVETLRVLDLDYVRTARAKRLSSFRIYLVHILPNVLTGTLTLGGLVLTGLIGGTVVVENVFAWPGLGTAIVRAITDRDFPMIQAIILFLGLIVVVVNAAVDLLLILLDPRSSLREA
jgi:peptide/nickel transport system permease protein